MLNDKKGLSAVVATLLIILLAIVAFGIVSVVVKQTVSKGAETIELSSKCLPLEIHATKIVQDLPGSFDITFSRSDAGEMIKGVKIVLIDAAEEETISENLVKEIEPLSKFTERIDFGEKGVGFIPVKVQLVPFFTTQAGKVHLCAESSWTDEVVLE